MLASEETLPVETRVVLILKKISLVDKSGGSSRFGSKMTEKAGSGGGGGIGSDIPSIEVS
jgi:uncharacterized spore protein YtfJ